MSIVSQKDANTVTLSNGFTFLDVNLGITIVNLNRAEVIYDARTGQLITNPNDFFVTCTLQSTTVIRIQRGGNGGAMVVHFQVIEYTVASGALVDRGSITYTSDPQNVTIPTRTQANRYSRIGVRSSASGNLENNLIEHSITSNSNLQLKGATPVAGVIVDWQTVYIPDQNVYNFSGTATGTSFNVNVGGFGIVKEESFVVQSMSNVGPVSPGIDPDEIKGAFLSSNTNLEVYSFFADDHDFTAQIVHRQKNRVDRDDNTFTTTPFAVALLSPVVTAETYINLAVPNGYICPVNVGPTNADEFCHTSQLSSPTQLVLQRFISTNTARVVTEAVYLDGNPSGGGAAYLTNIPHRRSL
jgi:hypothetical protein